MCELSFGGNINASALGLRATFWGPAAFKKPLENQTLKNLYYGANSYLQPLVGADSPAVAPEAPAQATGPAGATGPATDGPPSTDPPEQDERLASCSLGYAGCREMYEAYGPEFCGLHFDDMCQGCVVAPSRPGFAVHIGTGRRTNRVNTPHPPGQHPPPTGSTRWGW
jgi:hypothetical protein